MSLSRAHRSRAARLVVAELRVFETFAALPAGGLEYDSSLMGDHITYALKQRNASLLEFPIDWDQLEKSIHP